jgi:hypothetical protein
MNDEKHVCMPKLTAWLKNPNVGYTTKNACLTRMNIIAMTVGLKGGTNDILACIKLLLSTLGLKMYLVYNCRFSSPKYHLHGKLDPHSFECIFLNFDDKIKVYHLYDPKTQKVIISRNTFEDIWIQESNVVHIDLLMEFESLI